MRTRQIALLAALAAVLAGAAFLFWPVLSFSPRAPIEASRTAPPGPAPADRADWRSYGGGPGGGQYSSLGRITPANVAGLKVAWIYRTGDSRPGALADFSIAALEVTPILANGTLFGCTIQNGVFALDPATGAERWSVDLGKGAAGKVFSAKCRGVSYWEADDPQGPCDRRVFKGDSWGRLFALDADTGRRCEDFGDGGVIDLRKLDNGGASDRIAITSPPTIYRDVVITGFGMEDNVAAHVAHGIVRGFDARSGRELWKFDPIPAHLANSTGAANVWAPMAVDVDRGLLYMPTTSPSPDLYGAARKTEIPYASALVALDAQTGAPVWSFQVVHHNIYDYDLPAQPILFDLRRDGRLVPAVAQVTKAGYVFVLNRLTGEPLFPIEERVVPRSAIAQESAAPTQPAPRLPDAVADQRLKRSELFGLTWFDRAACQKQFDSMRYEGMFTPPDVKGGLLYPGGLGGANWGSAAFDPGRRLLVVRTLNIARAAYLVPAGDRSAFRPSAFREPMNGTPFTAAFKPFLSPLGVPCNPPPWGELTALDLDTGRTVWRAPLGQVPIGPMKAPRSWGAPGMGGPMVTGAGLTFVGATLDPKLRALETATGKVLWQARLPAAAMAVPMTYEVDGRQFVVVAAGGSQAIGAKLGDSLVAFALPPGSRNAAARRPRSAWGT